jgi:hypothetical protein
MSLSTKISRRLLLTGGATVATAPMPLHPEEGYAQTTLPFPADVFRLGVASGDPPRSRES